MPRLPENERYKYTEEENASWAVNLKNWIDQGNFNIGDLNREYNAGNVDETAYFELSNHLNGYKRTCDESKELE